MGFPCGSAGKESTCNARDLGLIPGLGRSPGEGIGYPLQYSGLENSTDCIVHGIAKSQTRLVTGIINISHHLLKHFETGGGSVPCIQGSLLLLSEKAMAPHSSTLAWKIPWTEEPGRLQSMGS